MRFERPVVVGMNNRGRKGKRRAKRPNGNAKILYMILKGASMRDRMNGGLLAT